MTDPAEARTQRAAVVSRRVTLATGLVLGGAALLAAINDRIALAVVLMVVVFLVVMARGLWTLRRGLRQVDSREKAAVPGAPVSAAAGPSPMDAVVTDLVGMNAEGLPYTIEARRTADGAQVDVAWKIEEMRWRTLFVQGSQALAWRMEVRLDPRRSHYRFTEYSGKASARAAWSPGGAVVRQAWSWHRGKTGGQQSVSVREAADGQVVVHGPGGARTSWEGVVAIKPSDAKVPVFTVLRNHGWRPPVDWFGARMFEK